MISPAGQSFPRLSESFGPFLFRATVHLIPIGAHVKIQPRREDSCIHSFAYF